MNPRLLFAAALTLCLLSFALNVLDHYTAGWAR